MASGRPSRSGACVAPSDREVRGSGTSQGANGIESSRVGGVSGCNSGPSGTGAVWAASSEAGFPDSVDVNTETTSRGKHTLLWLAVVLVIAWVVLKVALAVTSVALHLLWVAAVVMFVVWVIGLLRGRRA